MLCQRLDDRVALGDGQSVRMKDLGHFALFFFGNLFHFQLLALALFGVMFSVALGREIPAQAHRDRAGRNLGQARGHDDAGRGGGQAGQPGSQRKRHRQSVGHSNHDVAHGLAGSEVSLSVRSLRHCG